MIDNVCSSKVLENGLGWVKNVLVFIEILCPILFITFSTERAKYQEISS